MPSGNPQGAAGAPTPMATPGAGRNAMIDALRAVAALSVVGYHLAVTRPPGGDLQPYLLQLGWGVTIFFVISGFVLYRPFVVARAEGRPLELVGYALRRIARIGPGYWVALTLVVLFGSGAAVVQSEPLTFYGFAQIYSLETVLQGIGQAWTLNVEVTYYGLLPLIALGIAAAPTRLEPKMELAALTALIVGSLFWTAMIVESTGPSSAGAAGGFGPGGDAKLYWLPRYLGHFAIGMVFAAWSVNANRTGRARESFFFRHPTATWILVPIGYWLVSRADLGLTLRDAVRGLTAAALVWPAIASKPGEGVAGKLLAWRPLVAAGVVSYGIYLYHFAIITRTESAVFGQLGGTAGTLVWITLSLGATLAAGTLSWFLVERPSIQLSRRLSARFRAKRNL